MQPEGRSRLDLWKQLFPMVFSGIGLVLLIGAWAAFRFLPGLAQADLQRLEAMPLVTARSLDDHQIGEEVLLNGRISERNPVLAAGMVAYACTRDETDSDGDRVTRTLEQQRPALLIDAGDGLVAISESYSISNPSARQDGGRCDYAGVRQGDAVTVRGTVSAGSEGHTIAAQTLVGESYDAYLERERRSATNPPVVGIILAGLGVLFTGFGLVFWWVMRS